MSNNGSSQPTGNVVMDPDKTWKTLDDGSVVKRPEGEWTPVNPMNIAEDQYQGSRVKGRKKFGKIFDDEAQATIEQERKDAETLAEETKDFEDDGDADVDAEVAHLLKEEDEAPLPIAETLDLDNVGVVLSEIKVLDAARKGGDATADESLLTILQAEYSRADGGRQRIKGALSALGYKKPGR